MVTADILLILLDLNSKDRDVLEVNDNNIECSNLKFQKYMRSRNVPIKRHVTRQPYHKAYHKIK